MNRIIFPALLLLLISGCRITTTIVGEGTIISQSGHFFCGTGNTGDCAEDYQTAGSETLVAVPATGWTFVKWTNCNYASILSCNISFGKNIANNVWPITATFKLNDPPVQAATYTYNALGQRITKKVGNVTSLFQYDLGGNLIAELNSTGQALRQHIHLNNEPIAQLTRKPNGTLAVQYVHTDHLGTPNLLTNQSGNVVADIEAMPFGETFVEYAEVEYNKRFPGQYKDAETGLHYNYFRDYDPSTGRYVQSDPIGLGGGLNTYSYALQNPMTHVDPSGLEVTMTCRPLNLIPWKKHCAVVVWHENECGIRIIDDQYSLSMGNSSPTDAENADDTYNIDRDGFENPRPGVENYEIPVPPIFPSQDDFDNTVRRNGDSYSQGPYRLLGPNSNTAADNIIERSGGTVPNVPSAPGQNWPN